MRPRADAGKDSADRVRPAGRIIRANLAGFAVVVFFNFDEELYHGNEEKSKESSEKTG